jgi:hypothetical protein
MAVAFDLLCLRTVACSFRWFIVTESTVRCFVVREKYCWMADDSADKLKRTRCQIIASHLLQLLAE